MEEEAEFKEWTGDSNVKPGYFDQNGTFVPNKIPAGIRFYSIAISVCLVSYGIRGVLKNDLYLPGRRGRGIHLHDFSTVLCLISFTLVGITVTSVILDHYDKRDNEKGYFRFQKRSLFLALLFFVLAGFREFFLGK
jgi:hypothetical protein